MEFIKNAGFKTSCTFTGIFSLICASWTLADARLEEIIVVSEKRSESLQDLSQAVTALSGEDLDAKNIVSFVDLSAVAPGVTVAKNEGYKTVISIRGVGNETNQNAIAAPSVAFHMDGIFIASPFSLQTDFIDVDRIEILRGPQGTLFGQNSTGGAINVISKKPSFDVFSGKTDATIGDNGLVKARASFNIPVSESVATRTSFTVTERDGYSTNIYTGQELDDASHISFRTDWLFQVSDSSELRFFAQYFDASNNGAAIKGIDDPTPDPRRLSQETVSDYELTSKIFAGIFEADLDFATLKTSVSIQEDEIMVVRDNDRHNFGMVWNPSLNDYPAGTPYSRAEFNPETSLVETKTLEVNLLSNDPLAGKLDWIVGAFYFDHEIENLIREYKDYSGDGQFDPYEHNPDMGFLVWGAEFGFVSDALPSRESFSLFGQTTYNFSDSLRLVTGLRYSEDKVNSDVSNFFGEETFLIDSKMDKMTGRVAVEYDADDDTMIYVSYTSGMKPGGSNLTFGFTTEDDPLQFIPRTPAPPLVFPVFENETIKAYEFGLKKDMLDGRLRANVAAFFYDYENLQFQATDPDVFRGGVANIPEAEMQGFEVELVGLLSDSLTFDAKLSFLDSEVTADYEALDNIFAEPYGFGGEDTRYSLRQNINGNELAKSPDFTANISLTYDTILASGAEVTGSVELIHRGEFQQRVINNPMVDTIEDYDVINIKVGWRPSVSSKVSYDVMVFNATDEDGVNSSMTDVFGVSATGIELIAPRQIMGKISYDF